jgi:hypothetical protein
LIAKAHFDDGQCYQINYGNIFGQRQVEFAHAPDEVMGADL